MRFVHSYNTRPLDINTYDTDKELKTVGNIVYFATSLAYLKKIGQIIVLHTDTTGKSMLDYLPYDEIHLTLDEMPDHYSPRFWAAGKFFAIEKEPIGSVHIDGDVFIKNVDIATRIEKSQCDLFVQNSEIAKFYKDYATLLYLKKDYFKEIGIDLDKSGGYCTGLMCFKNKELKDNMIATYKNIVSYFSENYPILLSKNNFMTPDIIAEQQCLYQLSEKYNVETLLSVPTENLKINDEATKMGFQHVLTNGKYVQIDKCLKILKNLSPIIYNNTIKLCQNISNKLK